MNKKSIIFVNNNMNIGGVQKSLCNLLKEIADDYDITLFLFSCTGEYMNEIPENISVKTCKGAYKYFGISQKECASITDTLIRGLFAFITKLAGRNFVFKIMNLFQRKEPGEYDYAISFLHDGNKKSFYGGCNEFVLSKINAKQKITFLHCDYNLCGGNYKINNNQYKKFDKIAACSDGCKHVFAKCVDIDPKKIFTVTNCNNYKRITEISNNEPFEYDNDYINVISVARLSSEKGIDRGIKGVANALKNGIRVKYHIVGDGMKRSELQSLCNDLNIADSVVFHGNSDNPYRYMKNADLLLIPSYHEAAPLVIDEARCLGLPILSTETTSTRDMVLEAKSGWMCENSQEGIDKTLFEVLSQKESLTSKKQEMQSVEVNNSIALQQLHYLLES